VSAGVTASGRQLLCAPARAMDGVWIRHDRCACPVRATWCGTTRNRGQLRSRPMDGERALVLPNRAVFLAPPALVGAAVGAAV
jgi:hypothetical protein